LAASLLALSCACKGLSDAPPKLAVAVPLTGDLAADGRGVERAVTLAVEEAGKPVALASYDDGGDPLKAAAVARDIGADPEVVAVIGPLTSGCALEASRVYSEASLAMITPSATAPSLTAQQESGGWVGARVVFRLPPSDAMQGEALADHLYRNLGVRAAAVLHDRTVYGLGLAESFRAAFVKRGGAVTLFDAVERGARDFGPALDAVEGSGAGALFYGGVYPEAAPLVKQLRGRGFEGAFLAGDGVKSADFLAQAGAAAEDAVLSVGGVPLESLPSAADFVSHYTARFGEAPRTFDHYAYEAARIGMGAAAKAGKDRRKALEWIRTTRHESMVGPFIFDSKGDSLKSLVTVLRVRRGKFEPAY
jgi:branched-chain amino acid transport system substrate-binding protein